MNRLTLSLCSEFLDFVRQVGESAGCFICGDNTRIDAAHIRYSDAASGKINPGMGYKSDPWVVPLCRDCHDRQHKGGNERKFWTEVTADPLSVAALLFVAFMRGDFDAACQIIQGMQ